jgi:hypothetical protein
MPHFFGLTTEYMDDVYEMFFVMKKHGNWGFFELYALPIRLRDWFFKKLIDSYSTEDKGEVV